MVIKDFDSIFTHIGGFGRYQWILFGANCLLNVFLVIVYFGQIFMTLTPPHWCRPPPELLQLNLTEEQLKVLTIPLREDAADAFHSCLRYDLNFTQVKADSSSLLPDPTWPVTTCTYGWTYNYSLYYPTITSQLDWVCENDWRPPTSQSVFFVGSMLGSPILGWAADRWGRLPLVIFTNLLGAVAGIASSFSGSFVVFSVLRFVVGFTYEQNYTIALILLLEYVGTKYRTMMANVPVMVFLTSSCCALPWLALSLGNWSTFTIVIHSLQFLSIAFFWVMPESARWLLSVGRVDETICIIKKAARVNQRTLSPEVIKEFREFGEKMTAEKKPNVSVLDLFKTPVLRKRFLALCAMWMCLTIAYDGHMRNAENIGYDVFFSFTLAGLVELPADLLTILTTEWLGRRHTNAWSLVLSGLACLSLVFVSKEQTVMILTIAIIGRFFVTMAMNVAHQYMVEVIPTVARGQSMGFLLSAGFLSTFASPYVVYLSKYGHYLPYIILGALTIVGGAACQLLPETLHQVLPDTLEDGETFFTDQSCCYNPCSRRRTRKIQHGKTRDGEAGQDNAAFQVTGM